MNIPKYFGDYDMIAAKNKVCFAHVMVELEIGWILNDIIGRSIYLTWSHD